MESMYGRSESISYHTLLSYILNQIENTNNDTINRTHISLYVYITYIIYYQEIDLLYIVTS